MDVAEEPGELEGKGDPGLGVDGSRKVCDGHGPRIPDGGIHDHLALLRRRENYPTV